MLIFRLLIKYFAMKEIYSIALMGFLLLPPSIMAQNSLEQFLPTSQGKVVFIQVNEINDREIEDHMKAAKTWFSNNDFQHQQREETDLSRDVIEGHGSLKVLWGPNNFEQYLKTLKFRIEIILKRDRYQYRFYDFVVVDRSQEAQLEIFRTDTKLGARYNPDFYQDIHHKLELRINKLHQSFFQGLSSSTHLIGQGSESAHPTSSGSQGNGNG